MPVLLFFKRRTFNLKILRENKTRMRVCESCPIHAHGLLLDCRRGKMHLYRFSSKRIIRNENAAYIVLQSPHIKRLALPAEFTLSTNDTIWKKRDRRTFCSYIWSDIRHSTSPYILITLDHRSSSFISTLIDVYMVDFQAQIPFIIYQTYL